MGRRDFSSLRAERDNYEISIWVSQLGDLGERTVDLIRSLESECRSKGIDFRVEIGKIESR
jgi:hypothetical protein